MGSYLILWFAETGGDVPRKGNVDMGYADKLHSRRGYHDVPRKGNVDMGALDMALTALDVPRKGNVDRNGSDFILV